MKNYPKSKYRSELHHTGSAPNCVAVLHVFKHGDFACEGREPAAIIELGDFSSLALWAYEGELQHNLGLNRQEPKFKRLLKRGRKGLGYSYP